MISIFFSIILAFFWFPVKSLSASQVAASSVAMKSSLTELAPNKGTIHYLQVQNQEPVEQDEQEENEETMKPYEGFNLVAFGMIAVVLLIVAFVVVKVFQRMNKSRKGEM